jgi:hypothetical protein
MASLAAGMVLGAPPARASTTPVGLTHLEPVTWVDGQGRQYVLGDQAFGLGSTASSYQLFVMRDRADGEPDTTWGGDGTNKRTVAPTPPMEGATVNRIAAATTGGTITLIWDDAGCRSTEICDRWFQQIDATGATLAPAVAVEDLAPPFQALSDGSVLTGSGEGTVGWRGPDGTDRGAPEVPASTVRSGAVDEGGRLYLATADGIVRRWLVGGPADSAIDTGCQGQTGFAIGTAPESEGGGFAYACGSADDPVRVTRHPMPPQPGWMTIDSVPTPGEAILQAPTDVTVTADGTVWVGGTGILPVSSDFSVTSTVVAGFTPDGTIARHYVRETMRPGHTDQGVTGVSELRPVDSTHIAIADVQRCCFTLAGFMPEGNVTGVVVPLRPAPPACAASPPYIAAASTTSLDILFSTCSASHPHRAPTGYRVEVTSASGTLTKEVAETALSKQVPTTVSGVPAGRLLTVDVVAFNAVGDTVAPKPTPAHTVAPFRDVNAFAARPYDEGNCELIGLSEGDAQRDLVLAGTLAPEDHVANVLERCEAEHRIEPVARLYQAALVRTPDISGLRFWVNRSRNGTQLRSIASSFAGSREFQRRYGSLTNRQYVQQIYQNVLGRPGDPSGIAFWTKRLDTRKETRGGVLAGFSESAEHVRRTDPQMQPAAAWFLMLDRLPTAGERTAIAAFDEPRQDAALAILAMPEYAARIAG